MDGTDATIARAETPSPATGLRFSPGTMLAGRYRIVALLGRGGMGEVYRADDTRLGHPVALKFLPRYVLHDEGALERLYGEVRLGRQVAHPNVCRLYDIGESDEGHFITMEYVDGEDLASLLRRIGRLPTGKAIDIARDMSAGLAAAHDLGIVHRDLKPANVMVDGRGRARITDFGLASVADDPAAGFAGTPAYMSPEQLRGESVTPRSDIYALGLVLYEMFTGRRLFDGASLTEIQSQHRSGKPPSIASVVREIDPAVERVVMRCLEEDPASRPSSAHAVIAALPGGDPLAAALAAGETPSPEMVAAAGKAGDLQPRVAWPLLIAALGGILVIAAMTPASMLFSSKLLPKSTEVLEARSADILDRFGYTVPNAHTAHEWVLNDDYLRSMTKQKNGVDRWNAMAQTRPGVVLFTFRQSTRPLQPWNEERRIQTEDPPLDAPGMSRVTVDASGRLVEFIAVPPARDPAMPHRVDWTTSFREASLDPADFRDGRPVWSAPVDVDERHAWDGAIPQQKDIPLHIEAGAHRGKLVWFRVYGPWDQPPPLTDSPRKLLNRLADWANTILSIGVLAIGLLVAIRNVRRGRGDRKGAFRVSLFVFAAAAIAVFLRADNLASIAADEHLIGTLLGRALYSAAYVWVMYVAIEPFVRRRWPHTLTSWSRLLSGRFRDPMVGRDVLFGAIGGVVLVALQRSTRIVPAWFGLAPPEPFVTATSPFSSARHVVFFLLITFGQYLGAALGLLVALVIIRAIVKNAAIGNAILVVLIASAFAGVGSATPWMLAIYCGLSAATLMVVMLRFGLLSLAATAYIFQCLLVLPLTLDTSAWYFGRSFLGMFVIAAGVIYAFFIALGGKPLFGTPLLEE